MGDTSRPCVLDLTGPVRTDAQTIIEKPRTIQTHFNFMLIASPSPISGALALHQAHNGGVDAAARFLTRLRFPLCRLRHTPSRLASNDLFGAFYKLNLARMLLLQAISKGRSPPCSAASKYHSARVTPA
jgi:hypothetical protein